MRFAIAVSVMKQDFKHLGSALHVAVATVDDEPDAEKALNKAKQVMLDIMRSKYPDRDLQIEAIRIRETA